LLVPCWALIFFKNSKSLLLQKPARSCLHVQQWPCLPNLFCLLLLSFLLPLPLRQVLRTHHFPHTAGSSLLGEDIQF
jgi:hypothetical protein